MKRKPPCSIHGGSLHRKRLCVLLLLLTGGCGVPQQVPTDLLNQTDLLVVHYVVGGKTAAAEADDALGVLRKSVVDTDSGVYSAAVPHGRLEFKAGNRTLMKAFFVTPSQLEVVGFGQLNLKDDSFLKAVNAAVSKHEGREIDVSKEN